MVLPFVLPTIGHVGATARVGGRAGEPSRGRSPRLAVGAGAGRPPPRGRRPGLARGGLGALRGWTGPPGRHDGDSAVGPATARVRTARVRSRTCGFPFAVNPQGSVSGGRLRADAATCVRRANRSSAPRKRSGHGRRSGKLCRYRGASRTSHRWLRDCKQHTVIPSRSWRSEVRDRCRRHEAEATDSRAGSCRRLRARLRSPAFSGSYRCLHT